jgi:diaminobutyrate acetyltransferase
MWALAARAGLDLNSPYAYVMWAEYQEATSIVAEAEDELVGFVTGFRVPGAPDTVFVWQIAVDERQRGAGIGGRMLDELVGRTGAHFIEATVTPDNGPSTALFRALGARHGNDVEETLAYGEHLFPEGHDAEIRFRVPVTNDNPRD